MTLVFVIYLFAFFFEATLGALADLVDGASGFYLACGFRLHRAGGRRIRDNSSRGAISFIGHDISSGLAHHRGTHQRHRVRDVQRRF
jgi:hypothetical protein